MESASPNLSNSELARQCADGFEWFLCDIDTNAGAFVFARTDRDEIAQQTFLDPRWNPRSREIRKIPISAVIDELPPHPVRSNFIWHTSLCCSTLIARLIDDPHRNLSLREPKVLVTLADAMRAGLFEKNRLPQELVPVVFRLLSKTSEAGSQITIKPSNFSNVLIREGARCCDGKVLFLYSDLPSFLLSVAKGGVEFYRFARRLFGNIVGDSGQPMRWSVGELMQMTDLEIAGLAWHLQIAEFRRSWPALGDSRAASLNCDTFLEQPFETIAKLDAFFGLNAAAEQIRSAVEGPLMAQHAKLPGRQFSPQHREEEMHAIREKLGADLDRVVEWSYRMFPATPTGALLPNPLLDAANP